MYDEEYIPDAFYWQPEDIFSLAVLYNQAQPAIKRIQAFESWFDEQPSEQASLAVITALVKAGET